jgi:hypothetical protein
MYRTDASTPLQEGGPGNELPSRSGFRARKEKPLARKDATAWVCLWLLAGAAACAAPDPGKEEKAASSVRITSPELSLQWTKREGGWSLGEITTAGLPLANPRGFTNILFSEKKPPGGEVTRDNAGENFTFHFSELVKSSATGVHFRHDLPVAEIESIWEMDPEYPTDITVTMRLTAKSDGYFSMASPTLAALPKEDLEWGMIPGNWYGRELQTDLNLAGMYRITSTNYRPFSISSKTAFPSPTAWTGCWISWRMTRGRAGTRGRYSAARSEPRETKTPTPAPCA